jgi:hypothetical protein
MAASLKGKRTPPYQVPSVDITPDPPIFSLVTTFKIYNIRARIYKPSKEPGIDYQAAGTTTLCSPPGLLKRIQIKESRYYVPLSFLLVLF